MPSETKNGLSFSDSVEPDSEQTLRYLVPTDATIEHISVRIYPGPELDLTIRPRLHRAAEGETIDLLRTIGKNHIDGDNDLWRWDVSIPVRANDEIRVVAANDDDTETYDYRVGMDLDQLGGVSRVVRRLFG